MRTNAFISNTDRKRIVDEYLDGKTLAEISSMLQFKKPAISAILKKYKAGEPIERKTLIGGANRRSLNDEQVRLLRSWIDEDPSISLKSIQQRLLDEQGVSVCKPTISRYIKKILGW